MMIAIAMACLLGMAQQPAASSQNGKSPRLVLSAKMAAKPYQVGMASWYGHPYHGRKTASGEVFDMYQLTAAHPVLPLGSLVRVTNLHNLRSIIVRVNDRGPVPKSIIIDLSYRAAQALQLDAAGVEQVRLDLVHPTEIALATIPEIRN
jgi:rare lipoprotein A